MPNEPVSRQGLPGKAVDLSPQYPGTAIRIEKGDVFSGAGEQRATKAQEEALCQPVNPNDVHILPDTKSPYLPWSWYADRLTRAFGPMGWSMLPVTDDGNNPRPPIAKDNVMYREFILRAGGRFVGSAIGECAYNPNNQRMTYGDAVEGARSNALSRCCKSLGMASEIYDETWRENWIKQYCVCVYVDQGKGRKQLWRRNSGLPLKGEIGHANPPCPCADCASGQATTAKDGKPIIQSPKAESEYQLDGAVATADVYRVTEVLEKSQGERVFWDVAIEGKNGRIAAYTRNADQAALASSAKKQNALITCKIETRGKWAQIHSITPIMEDEGDAGDERP